MKLFFAEGYTLNKHPMIKKIIKYAILIGIAIFVYINFSIFAPILFALLSAVIFEPFVRLLQKLFKTEKRVVPVTIVFTIFVIVSSAIIYWSFTKLINKVTEWVTSFPSYAIEIQRFFESLIERFNTLIAEIPQKEMIIEEIDKQSQHVINNLYGLAQDLLFALTSWAQAIPNIIFVTLIYLITLFLFSLDLPRIKSLFYALFKKETEEKLRYVFKRLGEVFLGYWKAQFLLSIMIFILTYIGLIFISPNLALIMTIIIWVVDIIPLYVGPALILVPWAIIEMILGNMATGIQLLVLTLILLIIRRITEPKVLGDQIGLAALPTVLSMYFGYVFFGVMGLICGPFVVIALQAANEAGLFKFNIKI